MPRYTYRAIDEFGTTNKGLQDAASLPDLESRLKRNGLDLISARIGGQRFALSPAKIKRADLITFFFNLEQLLRAGVPLLETLADLRDTMNRAEFRTVIADLIESIESGKTFSAAMAQHPQAFDQIFISLTRAGEQSGRLPEVFAHITASLKWQDEMAAHSKTMLLYPAFVGTIVLGITFFLMIYLVPQLVGFIKSMGQEIPVQTRLLLATSRLFVGYWWMMIALPTLALIAAKLLLRSSDDMRWKFDALKLNLWLIGAILRKIILARFANTFAMMYRSGISILECLASSRDVAGNLAVAQSLDAVIAAIASGKNLTQSFQDTGMFPPLVIRMIKVGEATGSLDSALLNVSYFYERDVREAIKKIQMMIEPVLTILLGTLLGWVMLAVLAPIYDIIGKVKF